MTDQPSLDPTNGELDEDAAEDAAVDNELEVSAAGPGHVELRTIVMPGRHIVFVPNLKAGCTSLLWMLAQLAGLKPRRFHRSPRGAVSRAMTIHTMEEWPSRYRWRDLSDGERAAISEDSSWLRFTTLRDPSTRLWSAWQSKLLLREPGFTRRFGEEEWFPRTPANARTVVDDFRSFVRALGSTTPPDDAHWAPQTGLLASAPLLNHVGHLESMADTMAVLRDHVGPAWEGLEGMDENKSLLGYHEGLYDAESAELVNTYYADDFADLGYPPLARDQRPGLDRWLASGDGIVTGVAALCRAHERIEDLHRQARRATRYRDQIDQLQKENARLESWVDAARHSPEGSL